MRKFVTVICLFVGVVSVDLQARKDVNPFQFSFIDPIGINGLSNYKKTNVVSISLLGGVSNGNVGFDFAGLFSVNRGLNSGMQLSGIVNYAGRMERGLQVSGIMNIANNSKSSTQISGIANINGAHSGGVQIAGITNLATKGNAAFQLSGVFNQARSIGTQIGLINVASRLKGVQIGLINIANEADGVPIGLFNFVGKGGKYEFELSGSEALHASATFKFGTQYFYTLLSAGIHFTKGQPQYAVGMGFGSQVKYNRGWSNEFELLGYYLTEEGVFPSDINSSSLGQIRLLTTKQIFKHLKLFAGPTINMTVSDYVNPQTGVLGSSLNPYSLWENTSDDIRLRGWIGFTAGIRF